MQDPVNSTIKSLLNQKLDELENKLEADVLTYYGTIVDGAETQFLQLVEKLLEDKKDTLYIILTTSGGSSHAVERYVQIVRRHYSEVNFIVPDYAYSAGTIFCMSGDKIFMDYFSVLGPIDPQVMNKEDRFVPALGYLDKVNELINKAKNNTLTQAEFHILKELDLAELRAYEQAKELAVDQIKKWLVKYKFKNWLKTETRGINVTEQIKKDRAEEIAKKLSDNNTWKSHGRPIGMSVLEEELKLKIEDFGKDTELSKLIRDYYLLIKDFTFKMQAPIFVHTRRFI